MQINMDTAASIVVPEFDEKVIPKHGVVLSYLNDFIALCGGRAALTGLTTTDVCNQFVKKWTEVQKCSYNDLLREMQHPAYRSQSGVFISHAWGYDFLDLVDNILAHFDGKLDTVIWLDLFSNNQHKASSLDYDWWATTFRTAIQEFGYTVMVLSPWTDPLPLRRAWCLWELFCTYDTGCKFEVALGTKGHREFVMTVLKSREDSAQVMNTMLSKIDVACSEAYKPSDQAMIHKTVQEKVDGGFSRLNAVVLGLMRQWVVETLKEDVDCLQILLGEEHPGTLVAMNNLAGIHQALANYAEAEDMYSECLAKRICVLGPEHPDTLCSMNNLASLHMLQGQYGDAEVLLNDCVELCKKVLGESHENTLSAINNLGKLYKAQGKYAEADALIQKCSIMRAKVLGDAHPSTLTALNSLADSLHLQGKLAEAETVYVDIVSKSRKVLGDSHPDTLISINNLASVYKAQGKLDEAEPLFIECLKLSQEVLGDSHPDTLCSINNLAGFYEAKGMLVEAEPLYEQSLALMKTSLGQSHPSTLISMENLASLYHKLGKCTEAEYLLMECLNLRKESQGACHPDVNEVLAKLLAIHLPLGNFDKAVPLLADVVEITKVTMGETHPDTLHYAHMLEQLQALLLLRR